MTSRPVFIAASILVLLASVPGGPARADEPAAAPPPAEPPAPEPPRTEQARQQYEQGQTRYELGEYDEALAHFRRAYELSPTPMLLFNIAQTHRLKGDCRSALEVYRHFVRLDPGSARRADAEAHVRALALRCGGARSADGDALADLPPEPEVKPREPDRPAAAVQASWRPRLGLAALGAALVTGALAGGLYWWNDGRHERWSDEDRQLSAWPGGPSGPAFVARQNENDELLRSVRRVDRVTIGVAAVSAACLVTSAIVPLLPQGRAGVTANRGELGLAWTFAWR